MSAPVTTRRVAVFTLFLFTAVLAATTGASAMRPEPPSPPGHAPAAATSSGPDLTVWLLLAVAVVLVGVIGAGIATALHHRHVQHPAIGPATH